MAQDERWKQQDQLEVHKTNKIQRWQGALLVAPMGIRAKTDKLFPEPSGRSFFVTQPTCQRLWLALFLAAPITHGMFQVHHSDPWLRCCTPGSLLAFGSMLHRFSIFSESCCEQPLRTPSIVVFFTDYCLSKNSLFTRFPTMCYSWKCTLGSLDSAEFLRNDSEWKALTKSCGFSDPSND